MKFANLPLTAECSLFWNYLENIACDIREYDRQIEPWKLLIEKDIFRLSQKRILQRGKFKTSIRSVQITSICFYFRNRTICEVRETSITLYLCWMQSLYGKCTSKLLNLCNSINAELFFNFVCSFGPTETVSLSWWLFERIKSWILFSPSTNHSHPATFPFLPLRKLSHAACLNLRKGKNGNAAGCEWFVLGEEQNSKEFCKVTLLVVASATRNGWVFLGGCLKGERVLQGDFILARHSNECKNFTNHENLVSGNGRLK